MGKGSEEELVVCQVELVETLTGTVQLMNKTQKVKRSTAIKKERINDLLFFML